MSTKVITTNENYIHSCKSQSVELAHKKISFSAISYTNDEFKTIISFFLLEAPIEKEKTDGSKNQKSLKDYEWYGNPKLSNLERELLKSSDIPMFCFIKSDSINETLKQMLLFDNICTEHPRAVLKLNYKVTVYESGQTELQTTESRMECLFRHIRNALAHNCIYSFENGNILLEDIETNKSISARILIKKDTLLEWIKIIKNEK